MESGHSSGLSSGVGFKGSKVPITSSTTTTITTPYTGILRDSTTTTTTAPTTPSAPSVGFVTRSRILSQPSEPSSPQPSVDRLSVSFAADKSLTESINSGEVFKTITEEGGSTLTSTTTGLGGGSKRNLYTIMSTGNSGGGPGGSPSPILHHHHQHGRGSMARLSATSAGFQGGGLTDDEEGDDYSASISAILHRRASTRKVRGLGKRRTSSPYDERRRSSVFTTSSGESTAITMAEEGGTLAQEQIYENLRLHKEVLESIKQQPWDMRRKLKLVRQAKEYVRRHEGQIQERLAHSKSTKDFMARFNIQLMRWLQYMKREGGNLVVNLTPWELRIKEIESHFGSGVASYFTFLRWLFWINIVIAAIMTCIIIAPEMIAGNRDIEHTRTRKELLEDEKDTASDLKILWNFEGILRYSALFQGYYSHEKTKEGYPLPLSYFITGLTIYVYSFVAILRRMAKNSRQSKLSEKEDECIFSWKVFTGWDYMIGNPETAFNRFASITMGFKEALLEEKEKKKDEKNWKIITRRVTANILVLKLLALSAAAVVIVVKKSENITNKKNPTFWEDNQITIVLTCISYIFPNLFELIGFIEIYHPRRQLRWQLGRIMVLNLLNLYTLIFALFGKVNMMTEKSNSIRANMSTYSSTSSPYLETCVEVPINCSFQDKYHYKRSYVAVESDIFFQNTVDYFEKYPGTTKGLTQTQTTSEHYSLTNDKAFMNSLTESEKALFHLLKVLLEKAYPNDSQSPTVSPYSEGEGGPGPPWDTLKRGSVNELENVTTSDIYGIGFPLQQALDMVNANATLLEAVMPLFEKIANEIRPHRTFPVQPTTVALELEKNASTTVATKTVPTTVASLLEEERETSTSTNDISSSSSSSTTEFSTSDLETSTIASTTSTTFEISSSPTTDTMATSTEKWTTKLSTIPTTQTPSTMYTTAGRRRKVSTTKGTRIQDHNFRKNRDIANNVNQFTYKTSEIPSGKPSGLNLIIKSSSPRVEDISSSAKQTTQRGDMPVTSEEDPVSSTTAIPTLPDEPDVFSQDPMTRHMVTTLLHIRVNHGTLRTDAFNHTTFNDTGTIHINYSSQSKSSLTTDPHKTHLNAVVQRKSEKTQLNDCHVNVCENGTTDPKDLLSYLNCTDIRCAMKALLGDNYMQDLIGVSSDCVIPNSRSCMTTEAPTTMEPETSKDLRQLCWETMFGQELVKLTVMDLIFTIAYILAMDFFRAILVRILNPIWCWDLEKRFPQYGDFKIAENILHLVNNQGMIWMGLFFCPGLPAINIVKLVVLMYIRSWTVMTCNVPHETVFRASRSNNFYFAILLLMLFLCVLPVGYAITALTPSWHCGPFSRQQRIFHILTKEIFDGLPSDFKPVVDYIASPGIVIPLLMLLVLVIYYLISLTNSLREANNDLKNQLRRERTEERRKMFKIAGGGGDKDKESALSRWNALIPAMKRSGPRVSILTTGKQTGFAGLAKRAALKAREESKQKPETKEPQTGKSSTNVKTVPIPKRATSSSKHPKPPISPTDLDDGNATDLDQLSLPEEDIIIGTTSMKPTTQPHKTVTRKPSATDSITSIRSEIPVIKISKEDDKDKLSKGTPSFISPTIEHSIPSPGESQKTPKIIKEQLSPAKPPGTSGGIIHFLEDETTLTKPSASKNIPLTQPEPPPPPPPPTRRERVLKALLTKSKKCRTYLSKREKAPSIPPHQEPGFESHSQAQASKSFDKLNLLEMEEKSSDIRPFFSTFQTTGI